MTDSITTTSHGVLSFDYYRRAAEFIEKELSQPLFFVFSDDPKWCKENLRFHDRVTFVDHNPPDMGFEDMRLMSSCHHHIIANSSFSWWGAWLNPSSDKIVIAPSRWFHEAKLDPQDLLPAGWIKL